MSRRLLVILSLVLLPIGCTGRDFTRASLDSLAAGTTTEADIRQKFGTPYRDGLLIKNNETMKALNYAYERTAWSADAGVIPARAQEFFFWRGLLVGHHFTSSFARDTTDFDGAKAQQIRKGEATEAAVIGLLGPPQGIHRYPLIADQGARAAVYLYERTKVSASSTTLYRQVLVVQYDPAGTVTGVEYIVTGER